jgi:flagellar protein flaG
VAKWEAAFGDCAVGGREMALDAVQKYGNRMDMQKATVAQLPEPDEIKRVEIPLPEARTTKMNAEQMDVASQIRSAYAEQASQKEGRAKKTEEEILATNEKIRKAVEDLNKKMVSNTEAVFGIHDGTNRVTIKMVDKTSKKVIREYPPEETLDMLAKIWELAGMMIDEKG